MAQSDGGRPGGAAAGGGQLLGGRLIIEALLKLTVGDFRCLPDCGRRIS
jgi:hypothetical protein